MTGGGQLRRDGVKEEKNAGREKREERTEERKRGGVYG
jgi:hypothetical protein